LCGFSRAPMLKRICGGYTTISTVLPFKALRPPKQYAREVAAHPYDVLEWDEARKIGEANPKSFLHVEKPEIDFPADRPGDDPSIHLSARSTLERLIREGFLLQEEKPCFYVYGQKQGDHIQYGIVGCVSLAEYEAGQIKKHELTTVDKERDRIRNIDTVNANTGLVFCVYPASDLINRLVEEIVRQAPEYDFIFDNGVAHSVWVVRDDPRIEAIQKAFHDVTALYIADGHHRVAAAAAVARLRKKSHPAHRGTEDYNFFVAGLFPHNQARIMGYDRVVKDLNGLTENEFLGRVGEGFIVSPESGLKSPSRPHEFGMYLGGRGFRLHVKEDRLRQKDVIRTLDVSLLQDNLLAPVLGIHDPRSDKRIKFVGSIRGAAALQNMVDSKEFAVAFSLFPTSLSQLMAVADSGQVMPPKSTWFEPKLLSGLFVHLLD
jgi:uncharacterized protein (DUF1015 family)